MSTRYINSLISRQNSYQYKWSVKNYKDMLRDNWDYIINDELNHQFEQKTYAKLRNLRTKELNIFKRVVSELSMLYKSPAKRTALVGEVEDKTYLEIKEQFNFDTMMAEANRLTNATNATLVRCVWRDGAIDYDLINFDNAEIICDPKDWKKVIGVKYYVGLDLPYQGQKVQGQNSPVTFNDTPYGAFNATSEAALAASRGYIYTTNNEFFEEEDRGKIIEFKPGKDGEDYVISREDSPYQKDGEIVLPFVLILKSYPVDYLIDYSSGCDLFDLTLNTAVNMVHLNNLIKYQSYIQVFVFTDKPKAFPEDAALGPDKIMLVPKGPDATGDVRNVDLQSDIKNFYQTLVDRVKTGVAQYGMDVESFSGNSGQESGFHLEVRRQGLVEQREKQLPIYREAEHKIFEVTRIVNNVHNKKKISDDAVFEVDFAETDVPIDKREEADIWMTKIKSNVNTPIDWMMSENPDLDEEGAIKRYQENKAFNQQNRINVEPVTSGNITGPGSVSRGFGQPTAGPIRPDAETDT